MKKITKDLLIADVLKIDRGTAPIFMKHGLFCLGCPSASMESIEDAAAVHGLNVDILIKDLNEYLESLDK